MGHKEHHCKMKSAGYLLLQQDDFLPSFAGSFQQLRTAGELFDVTLACEDETIGAHKVVLAACSSFFRNVFRKTKQTHPFVYLKGVLHKDLVALLDYIYTGETQVAAEDVDRFIEVAREMKVNGLSEGNEEVENIQTSDEVSLNEGWNTTEELDNETSKHNKVDDSSISMADISNSSVEVNQELGKEGKGMHQLLIEISERMERVTDAEGLIMWKCTECGKMMKKKDKLKNHVEIHLTGFSHACVNCDKVHKTRASLSTHMSTAH